MHKHPAFRLRGIQRRHRHHLLLCLYATYTPRHPTRLTLSLLLQNVIHIQLPRLCLKMPLWAHRCKRCRHGSKWQERRHLSPRRPYRCEVPERWCERQGVVVIYVCGSCWKVQVLVRHLHFSMSQVVETSKSSASISTMRRSARLQQKPSIEDTLRDDVESPAPKKVKRAATHEAELPLLSEDQVALCTT